MEKFKFDPKDEIITEHCEPHDHIIGYRENLAELIHGYRPYTIKILVEGTKKAIHHF